MSAAHASELGEIRWRGKAGFSPCQPCTALVAKARSVVPESVMVVAIALHEPDDRCLRDSGCPESAWSIRPSVEIELEKREGERNVDLESGRMP